jgi:hypothetical protein
MRLTWSGLDSARNTEKSEAQAIWSMAFEDLDPSMLDRSHGQMVAQYYKGNQSAQV